MVSKLTSLVLVIVGLGLFMSQNPQVQALLSNLSNEVIRSSGFNLIQIIGLAIAGIGMYFLGRSSRG